ncbi:DUF2312 domain-containing protein [Sphingoaurantiacus capsulatus]|uniref:UPF0335 protein ACFOMD_11635 n=1 Tax=Sphingoaurantiacus capsulatus TaxID=1771310 RepID=A0ABV7XD76_9SPHN
MSGGNVSAEQLRLFIERIERLNEEKQGIADDIKDVFAESKGQGYDVKTMRSIIKLRKMERDARMEQEALLETYKTALGLAD